MDHLQEFDPIKYILQSIPEEGGDATYFDKQVSGGSLCSSCKALLTKHMIRKPICSILLSDVCMHKCTQLCL